MSHPTGCPESEHRAQREGSPLRGVHVETAGQGSPLVLLHGWAMHSGLWGPLLPWLAARHRVHAVDLPGHGHSAVTDPYTLDAIVAAVDAAVPAGEPLAVLGWSLGGAVAMRWARARPARVARLVLVCTSPRFVAGDGLAARDGARRRSRASATSYRSRTGLTLQRFLSLQLHGSDHGRAALALMRKHLFARGEPAPEVLGAALRILGAIDLRADAASIVAADAGDRRRPRHAGAGRRGALARRRDARRDLRRNRRRRRTRRSCRTRRRSAARWRASSMAAERTGAAAARDRPRGGAPALRARRRDLRRRRGAAARGRGADGGAPRRRPARRRGASSMPAAAPATRWASSRCAIRAPPASGSTSRCRCSACARAKTGERRTLASRLLAAASPRGLPPPRCSSAATSRRCPSPREPSTSSGATSRCSGCPSRQQAFADCLRVLRTGGLLTFSTFGPDTLRELRARLRRRRRRAAREPLHRHARPRRHAGRRGLRRPGDGDGDASR